jgi:hypothetical protein
MSTAITSPSDVFSRSDLLTAYQQCEREIAEFFGSLSNAEFTTRVGDAWTPEQQLMHLNTSINAVGRGFSMSKWLLRFRFGRARRPSRSYDEIRDFYRSFLAKGFEAPGAFVPPDPSGADDGLAVRRMEVMARWQRVNERLRDALERWTDNDLEKLQLPHPAMGKLTAREMLLFALYHNYHHLEATKRRLPRFSTSR